MPEIRIPLTKPQEEFVFSKEKFPAFVGGYGAGKSEGIVTRLLLKIMHPKGNVGYFAPTNDLIRLIGWPKFAGKLEQWKLPYKLNEGYRFVYERWAKEVRSGYALFKSPTRDNPFLPDDDIEGLKASYSPRLLEAYLNGDFVNLYEGQLIFEENFKAYGALPRVSYDFITADTAWKDGEHNDDSVLSFWCVGVDYESTVMNFSGAAPSVVAKQLQNAMV